MAQVTWIILGILVVSCSAQFGFNRNERFHQRPQLFPLNNRRSTPFREHTNRILQSFGINPDDHKCFTLARRPFYMTRIVQYPCSRSMPGLPVIKSFMGPMGPLCVSYIREPVYRYYKIPLCCPGYTMDITGKCSIRTNGPMRNPMGLMKPFKSSTPDQMMTMATNMRQAMWLRAKKDMDRRRAMFLMSMANTRRPNPPAPRPPKKKSSIVPLYVMYKMHQKMMKRRQQQQTTPRVAFLKFRPSSPPMPHPVQQPPLSGRFVNLIRNKFTARPTLPFMMRPPMPPMQAPPMFNMIKPPRPIIPKLILSSRGPMNPFSGMREFHPRMPEPQPLPRIERPQFPDVIPQAQEENFPMIPEPQPQDHIDTIDQAADGFQGDMGHDFAQYPLSDGFQSPTAHEAQMPEDSMMQVDLPAKPVEMPDLIVEQAPVAAAKQESCIVTLEAAVKTCLTQNNIDVPDVMSAFEPFNDDKSRILCEAEDAIFKCISAALNECTETRDAEVARDMLLETAQTVRSMCELRSASVSVQVDTAADSARVSPSQSDLTADTVNPVENVDAIPTDVNSPTPEKDVAVIEDKPAAAPSVETVKEAIQHEVHVQELRMKEYLLPILLGAGIGFIVLVLCMSLIICCCCKRKLKKKMKLAKEAKKPALKEGIYTIGIAPPTYEVKGIPPMYYEEAKGEKITSKSPSVVEGETKEEETPEN